MPLYMCHTVDLRLHPWSIGDDQSTMSHHVAQIALGYEAATRTNHLTGGCEPNAQISLQSLPERQQDNGAMMTSKWTWTGSISTSWGYAYDIIISPLGTPRSEAAGQMYQTVGRWGMELEAEVSIGSSAPNITLRWQGLLP
eukprot:175540-Amphidinium_carterae.1